jgi:ribosome-associated protein
MRYWYNNIMESNPGIQVTKDIVLAENELEFNFIHSSGPGGQNVNKVATAVQLRFDVLHSASLPDEVRERLIKLAQNRITDEGVLVVEAKRYRTQEQNRQDAIKRLAAMICRAAEKPRERRRTRVSWSERERRLKEKRQRGEIKRLRRFTED